MALIAQYLSPHGILLSAAYIRLQNVQQRNVPEQRLGMNTDGEVIPAHTLGNAIAIIYAGASQREMEFPAVNSIGFTFPVDPAGPPLIAQAYAAAVALPEFVGAIAA